MLLIQSTTRTKQILTNWNILLLCQKLKKNIKIPNSDEQKAVGKWQNRKPKHIKRMDNNCQIPELHTDIRRHIKTGSLEVRVMYRYVITFLLVECYLWELARRIYSSEFS